MLRPRPLGLAVPTSLPALQQTVTAQPLVRALTFGMLAGALTVAFGGNDCKVKSSYSGAAIAGGLAALLLGLVGNPDPQSQTVAYEPAPSDQQPTPGF